MQKDKKPVIVSVSSHGREDYNRAMLNLIDSKKRHCDDYDMLLISVDGNKYRHRGENIRIGDWPKTRKYGKSESHKKNPYQFKTYAVWLAIELGYTQIIWCDSTIQIQKDPSYLWPMVSKQGITTWDNFIYPLESWITDEAMSWLNYDNVKGVKQIMACCMMFDTKNPKTIPIIEKWIKSGNDGCFKSTKSSNPNFRESRHDQAMMSLLLHDNKINVNNYGVLAYPNYVTIEPTFLNCGLR